MTTKEISEFSKRIKALTNEEVKALLIKAGIYDENMKLMPHYKRDE